MRLKWNKVQWRRDQLVGGNWAHPTPGAANYVEQQLDMYHKSVWFNKVKRLLPLDNLCAVLLEYQGANVNNGDVLNVIKRRLKEVTRKRLKYNDALKFVTRLDTTQIMENSTLRAAFLRFCSDPMRGTGPLVQFLIDVGPPPRNWPYMLATYFPAGGASDLNLASTLIDNVRQNGPQGYPAVITEVTTLLNTNDLIYFKKSDLLKTALESLVKFQ